MAAPEPAAQRLFIALWPDDASRQALLCRQHEAAWPAGARLTRPADLHLTLHFLGAVPWDRQAALQRALATASSTPVPELSLQLDRFTVWPNHVAVMLADAPDAALLRLHQRIGAALQAEGFVLEGRPWQPHVTLARKARGAAAAAAAGEGAKAPCPPVAFTAREFVLVESRGGYRVLQRFG